MLRIQSLPNKIKKRKSKVKKLAEGKTKIIWLNAEATVLIESKDIITAGDGARQNTLEGKGILATETTCNCFSLLNKKGIPTHFIRRGNERTFLAERVQMIPIELVVRRIATGSYLKRYPEVPEGTVFYRLVLELFYKADDLHDPLIFWNARMRKFELFNAQKPLTAKSYLFDLASDKILKPDGSPFVMEQLTELQSIARETFLIIETAWKSLDVVLADLKIECGWTQSGLLVVADVIDNDSWRIWPGGKKEEMKDKQVYRNLEIITAEALKEIGDNYTWVAEATKKFI